MKRITLLILVAGCNLQLASDKGVFRLHGSGPRDVWAIAGNAFQPHDRVLHYDGEWVEAKQFTGVDLMAIHARAPNDVWVGGRAALYHFDGSGWSSVAVTDGIIALGDDWAVGAHGTVLGRDGAGWRSLQGAASMTVTAAWGAAPDDLWGAVEGTLRHFDGHSWDLPPAELPANLQLDAIWGSARDDVWAGGYGQSAHFDGQRWTTTPLAADTWVMAIWGSGRGEVWASGYHDVLLRNWSTVAHPTENQCGESFHDPCTTVSLNDIWGSGPNDVWVAGYLELDPGGKPILRHFDGTSWAEIDVP